MSPVFLSEEDQGKLYVYLHIIFGCSIVLHCICLVLLIKRTPSSQIVVRNYLILIQVVLLVSDVHLDVGMRPIPVLQATAVYGTGLLLTMMGVSAKTGAAGIVILWMAVGIVIIMCIVRRHQSVMLPGNPAKFGKQSLIVFHTALTVILPIPPLLWSVTGADRATIERLLLSHPLRVAWIRDRGPYYIEEWGVSAILCMVACILTVIGCTCICVVIFLHMFYTLGKDSSRRSEKSTRLIVRSLINLFIQLMIPFSLFVIPATFLAFNIIFREMLSFETTLIIFYVIPLHSIGHSIILLSITSSYRELFTSFFKKSFMCKVSVIPISPTSSR